MLVFQIALGVFLGALAFHYRKQLAPVLGALVTLAVLAGGGVAYYLFTTPEQRHAHVEGAIGIATFLAIIVAGVWITQMAAWARASAWAAEASQRWNRQRPWHRVVIGLGVGALLIFAVVLRAPAGDRSDLAAMLVALAAIIVGAGWALNWINKHGSKPPAVPKE